MRHDDSYKNPIRTTFWRSFPVALTRTFFFRVESIHYISNNIIISIFTKGNERRALENEFFHRQKILSNFIPKEAYYGIKTQLNAWDIYTTTTTRKREKHLKAKKERRGKKCPEYIYTPMPVITNIVPYLIIFLVCLFSKLVLKEVHSRKLGEF